MKRFVRIKHIDSELNDNKRKIIDDFVLFLQKKFPLKSNIDIVFLHDRLGKMTTGSRSSKRVLKILSSGRMLIDVLRTLSHEWIHEYEHENLDMDFSQDIGGEAEDMANSKSGAIVKMFQKEFPHHMGLLYQ